MEKKVILHRTALKKEIILKIQVILPQIMMENAIIVEKTVIIHLIALRERISQTYKQKIKVKKHVHIVELKDVILVVLNAQEPVEKRQ